MATTTPSLLTNSITLSPNKRNHKAPKIKTQDYHNKVVKKRRISSKKKVSKPSSKSKSQPTIVSFLSTSNKQTSLKEEDFFINPSNLDGLNLQSLRRHFHSITTKPNIVALIKKSVIHNNTNPSTQKIPSLKRYSQRRINSNSTTTCTLHNNNLILLKSGLNRCYIEDFISLTSGTDITLLVPQKLIIASKKKHGPQQLDEKLIKVVDMIDPALTQIGGPKDLYYVIESSIASTPNRNAAYSGIDKLSIKSGLHGIQKYGSTLSIDGTTITPLIKWRDVLNGRKDGIQV